jgi:hypothetical protein
MERNQWIEVKRTYGKMLRGRREIQKILGGRWIQEVPFNEDELTKFFKLEQIWTTKQGKEMQEGLLDVKKMEEHIRRRRNISAQGMDEITFQILKLEPEQLRDFV